MAIVLIALLIVLILAGVGFAVHVLWWLASAELVIWPLGFLLRQAPGPGPDVVAGTTDDA
jgi:hypothetical protein